FLSSTTPLPPPSPLLPYTTLFRSPCVPPQPTTALRNPVHAKAAQLHPPVSRAGRLPLAAHAWSSVCREREHSRSSRSERTRATRSEEHTSEPVTFRSRMPSSA